MNRKSSPLATRSKELKGTALGAGIEQLNRFASRQAYWIHDEALTNPEGRQKFQEHRPTLDDQQRTLMGGLEHQGYSKVAVPDFFAGDPNFSWDDCLAESAKFVERIEKRLRETRALPAKSHRREGSFLLALASLILAVPITAIAATHGGIAAMIVVWAGIVVVNAVYNR